MTCSAPGPPAPESVPAIAAKYGLEFGAPDWLPDVMARYELVPPPGAPAAKHVH